MRGEVLSGAVCEFSCDWSMSIFRLGKCLVLGVREPVLLCHGLLIERRIADMKMALLLTLSNLSRECIVAHGSEGGEKYADTSRSISSIHNGLWFRIVFLSSLFVWVSLLALLRLDL